MHKFNIFGNVINFLGKENRLCFEEAVLLSSATTPADVPAGTTETVDQKATREAEEAAKKAEAARLAAEEAARKEAERKAAERKAAGEEPAADLKKAPTESKEVDLTGKLKLSELQTLLKDKAGVEASPEEIKKAFRYYQLDGRERGYVKGAEYRKTKAILDGVKKLLKDGDIKPEQLAYIGSVDGTHYLLEKVLAQSEEWHNAKKDALETLLGFIGYNKAIFVPADKKPDTAMQGLIKDYIQKVGSDLDAAKQLITDNQDAFLLAQGIFNMALAVQRAHDLKKRITGDQDVSFKTNVEVIRIELGTEEKIPPDRKSGLLLLDENSGVLPMERDKDPGIEDEEIVQKDEEPSDKEEDTPVDQKDKTPPASDDAGKSEEQAPAAKAPDSPAATPKYLDNSTLFSDGQWSQKGTPDEKFKGKVIDEKGIVATGTWSKKSNKWEEGFTYRRITQSECEAHIKYRLENTPALKDLKVELFEGKKYDYKKLWANTLNIIAGLKSIKASLLAYIKDKRITVKLNPDEKLLASDKKPNQIIIKYKDPSAKIKSAIEKAVKGNAEHEER